MILQWNISYDHAYFAWYTFCTAALLATLLPGLMLLCTAAGGRSAFWRQLPHWLPILSGCGLLWLVLGFSLAFGPGPIPETETPVMSGDIDLQELLEEAVDPDSVIDDVGRGGVIGGFRFAALRSFGPEGDPTRPRFAARRPDYRLPLAAFVAYQTAVFLAVAGAVGALVQPYLSWSRTAVFLPLWSVAVYAPMAHWVWGDGWLALQGAIDPGGGLLHVSVALAAVAAVAVAGPERSAAAIETPVASQAVAPPATGSPDMELICGCLLICLAQLILTASFSVYVTQVPLLALGVVNLLLAGAGGCIVWSLLEAKLSGEVSARAGALGLLAGCCSLAGGGAMLAPQSAIIVGGGSAAAAFACLGSRDRSQSPDAGRLLMAAQGVPAAIGLVIPAVLGVSNVGMQRLDQRVVTSLVDGDVTQLIHQLKAVGAMGLLVFVGTALLLLAARHLYSRRNMSRE